ncbi:feruloyl-CoA synthase [Burkholderia sp. SIMBA_043]|uniref:feruloyl-CoA synthase n=1 Tax=Burkholderia TaxID=32008 RepID=UPI0005D97FC8|nr:feruloyl-CoA synthase [Burkholderia vietnamiensis]AJY05018.1 AMP-binding enzyme family protein [Burkholderia vietnamiensis LMG 10929]AVR13268.1 feruloyl-CoA synthase [Burkholderia vietnamiensis]KVM50701.1 feruloyl-CoA synthase [Burkholderia vietnamiensis]KVR96919.1 feruloyl-CoA synthase [Burkholderia vietnamiensis]UBI23297.1 feruloyl-CoA synthase [Burkholderia vietnamiensis]
MDAERPQLRDAAVVQPVPAGYRPVAIGTAPPEIAQRDGCWTLRAASALGAYPRRLTDRLVSGAQAHPDRWLVARRGPDGAWIGISYAQMLERARAIGQALLDRGLSAERPIAILSGNDLEHLQLAFGAMWAGIPHAPLSPAYSLVSSDYGKLRHALALLTPGLVFASDGAAFRAALDAAVPSDVERVVVTAPDGMDGVTRFSALLDTRPAGVDAAHDAVTGDTIAKFLFTSGSTRLPKAVPTTHRMLCSNQQMLLETFPQFGLEPPVLVDWLPWNHTFGGSHNVGIALYNGGTLYIDDGKPVAGKFAETLRNLREIAPTVYFNVPKGWEELAAALETDAALRDTFFSRVRMYFFAGAGLSQAAWDRLERVTLAHCGERIRIMAGLGMTEAAPSCMFTTGPMSGAGYIGLPAPGCDAKLVPIDGKLEARFRGPNVMAGYWRASGDDAREVFDDEGYYRSGDAVRFVDPARPEIGLMFDGRIAEDFKLSSGTFVSVGPMRARIVSNGAPYVQDAVITGMNRDDVGVMIFPRIDDCRRLAGAAADADIRTVLQASAVRAFFADLLARLNRDATGSASFVTRLCVLDTPPSLDLGEITDKGSINQRAVLAHRAAVVDAMYGPDAADAGVIVASAPRRA